MFLPITIGSTVTFLMRVTRKRYVGMVCEFLPPSGISGFGIKNAIVCKKGKRRAVASNCFLGGKQELQVIEGANRANTNQDGQNNNRDEGSSSK
ncbi:unnamed protein product [Arabis nemorensis]|uniref:Uncharacterized protein n=1 Tax=Arabis nemorensis TaxID=586526 RepID=A0A565AVZ3_9BRAS|nr:unnamed protein product [Arabis nemorensis]